jgi:FLVCR family feline leukemia virus subgroup C receptor-related protein
MFLLDRKGLKLSCILGALLTAIGACLKCAAVRPDLFAVAMSAQTVCAIAQAFTLGIPARLSALWFGPTEIATATSIGVFGNQLGSAIGFLIPPSVVQKSESIEFMQKRFYFLLVPVAAACIISFILALICTYILFNLQNEESNLLIIFIF